MVDAFLELDHLKYTYAAQIDTFWILLDVETGEIAVGEQNII